MMKENSGDPSGMVDTIEVRIRLTGDADFKNRRLPRPPTGPMPAVPDWVPSAAAEMARTLYSFGPDLEERARLDRLLTHSAMRQVWELLEKSGGLDKAGMLLLCASAGWRPVISKGELAEAVERCRTIIEWLRNKAEFRGRFGWADGATALRAAADSIEAVELVAIGAAHAPHVVDRHRSDPAHRGFAIHFAKTLRELLPSLRQRNRLVAMVTNVVFETALSSRQVTDMTRR